MKTDEIYPYYLDYLNDRMIEGKISKGSFSLLKISRDSFEDFKYRFENDELFSRKVIELHKSEVRDKKIDDIVNLFNTNQSEIVASSDNGNNDFTLNFTGPCTNSVIDILYDDGKGSTTYPVELIGGVCGSTTIYKNCITEEELALMLDKISKLINICFQPYDFTYTDLHT